MQKSLRMREKLATKKKKKKLNQVYAQLSQYFYLKIGPMSVMIPYNSCEDSHPNAYTYFQWCLKVRVLTSESDTIELCKKLEACGIAAIGVHGRTKAERPRHRNREEMIRTLTQHLRIPVIAK